MPAMVEPGPLTPPSPDDRLIWDTWLSAHRLPALLAADDLGAFALLHRRPMAAPEAARELGVGPRASTALLGLLAALGFLEERDGVYHLTDVSRHYLLPESPWYWGAMLHSARELTLTHAFVKETLQRDRRPDRERSTDGWKSGHLSPERALQLTRAMHAHSQPAAVGLAGSGLLHDVSRLLDVGGGSGCFTIALARAMPQFRGTILELPPVCAAAQSYIDAAGVADRVVTQAADMFRDPWPTGHDAVFFSNIFHDWDETTCRDLARRAFEALPSGGRILLHEMLLDENRAAPLAAAAFSMHMMIFTEGKQFTASELIGLLRSVGFVDCAAAPSYGYYSLVSGRKS